MVTEILNDRSGRSLEEMLERAQQLVEDADYPSVRRWRAGGGKVVGHFQVYFPEDIAHAAGLLPVKIRGAQIEARRAEARFGSYLCSILKTSLELALNGRLDLDLFVSHPICEAARNLAAIWGRNRTYPCHILYLPQNGSSPHAAAYLRGEYERLRRLVQDIAGRQVTDDDLRASIGVFNENRRLLRRARSSPARKALTTAPSSRPRSYSLTAATGVPFAVRNATSDIDGSPLAATA